MFTLEIETRNCKWTWCYREESVTLPKWYWRQFDAAARKRNITSKQLQHKIWSSFPRAPTIHAALVRFLEQEIATHGQRHLGVANDCKVRAQDLYGWRRRTEYAMPVIKWSPFKFIARPRRIYP